MPAALLVPLTGPSAALGLSMQRAASLLQPVLPNKLILLDSGETPASADTATRAAMRQGARLILGPLFSGQVRAVVAAAAGRAAVLSFSNDESLRDSGAFLLGLTGSQLAAALLGYARTRGVRSVSVQTGADGWSRQLAAAAQRHGSELGLTVTPVALPAAPITTAQELERSLGRLPDALLIADGGPAALDLAAACRAAGVQPLATPALLASGPAAGAKLVGAWIAAPDPTPFDAFVRSFEASHGGAPGMIAALAHDAALIARDLQAGGGVERARILAVQQFAGATGKLRFRSDGSCVRELAILAAGAEGFTLIDRRMAMALFGLIAVAGLALVESVLGVRAGTAGRLDRLAELRRAMYLLQVDLEQVDPGPISGGGDALAFRRHGFGPAGIAAPVRYALVGGTLTRGVAQGGGQRLLSGVAAARWRFYAADLGWSDRWPPSPERARDWPAAIELVVTLAQGNRGPTGMLRRVVALPTRP